MPSNDAAPLNVLVQKRDALVTALTQLSHAAQEASWASIEYFQALHPDADKRHPPPSLHHIFSAARTIVGAAGAGVRGGEDDLTIVDGKAVKGGKMSRAEKRKAKDPNEPKRPVTAYFLFLQHARPQLSKDMPDAKGNELQQEATERWNNMSEEDKRPYRDLYEANYAKFKKEIEEYKAKKEGRLVTATEEDAVVNEAAESAAEESEAEEEQTPARPTKVAKNDSTVKNKSAQKAKAAPKSAKKETPKRQSKKVAAQEPEEPETATPKSGKKDRKRKR